MYLNQNNQGLHSKIDPIHVMHIIDKLGVSGSSIHGITQVFAQSIPRFDPKRFKFSVYSLRRKEVAGEVLKKANITHFYLNKNKFDPSTISSLFKIVKKEKPHVLHLHGFGACNFGRIVSILAKIPNIVHEHNVMMHQPRYQTVADALLSPYTTKAIAISTQVRDYMVEKRKIKPEKLETFFYGLPLAEFRSPSEEEIIQERMTLGIAPDERIVCNVGRLDPQKGLEYLLRAARLILKDSPNTRFLIVGDGPDRSMLESLAQQEGIAEKVIFTGYSSNVPVLVSLCDIFVIPSLWEGGPITLFEAMNLRKPVIGTRVGLMGEVIQDGETGFLVPCKDVESLVDRINKLLQDPDLSKRMGEKGWSICQQYDICHYVNRLEQIYQDLAA
jgi:glycosyltransferase involved in cell wall biosynthesis